MHADTIRRGSRAYPWSAAAWTIVCFLLASTASLLFVIANGAYFETERLGAAHGSVSDIFLPDAVARTTPIWSTALLAIAGLLHLRAVRLSRR